MAGQTYSSASRWPAPSSSKTTRLAAQRAAAEERTRNAILDGRTLVDVLGLNERIRALGYVSQASRRGRIQMNTWPVRYTIDPREIKAFESFAGVRIRLVDHHGYFLPSEEASDGARALFSFPSMGAYEQYRQRFDFDAAFIAADCIRDERGSVLRYERSFLGADK